MSPARESIRQARRIVIKVGTRVATEADNAFSSGVIGSLVRQIAALMEPPGSRSFIIVSSGAIAMGLNRLGMEARPRELDLLQAAAAVGQSRLMHAYEHEFEAVKKETAQILLTSEDIRGRTRYLNIRNTIFTLWSFGAVPIVNENDTVSFDEIRFGDNDIISAHIANMLDADLLVMLTDTDGVFDMNPKTHTEARVLRTVERVTDAVLAGAEGKGSSFSTGGMESKIRAADIATRSGVGVVIARGRGPGPGRDTGGTGDRHVVRPHDAPHEGPQEMDGLQSPHGRGDRRRPRRRARAAQAGEVPAPGGSDGRPGRLLHGQRDLDPERGRPRSGARPEQLLQRGAREDPGDEHEKDTRCARRRGIFRRGGAP